MLLGFLLGLETIFAKGIKAEEINLQVGIIQRFGGKPIDDKDKPVQQLTVSSSSGDYLNLKVTPKEQPKQNLKTQKVVLKVEKQSLTKPILSERLVLSDHATFETAEDSANLWKTLGIEVEIAQPGRWQVWAKRDVYPTPLVRRWLLHSLQANGYTNAYLNTELLSEIPRVVVIVNDKRFYANELEISSAQNKVTVKEGKNPQSFRVYGGSLRLQSNAYGSFTLVNNVPLETYLRGVVPYEIVASVAPPEAIAAQTIIARTYALRNLRRFQVDNYQLCATVHCQVYKGLSGATEQTDRAIAETKGLVLTYQNELVDALYSSATGGVTAYFGDTWNGAERPYLKSVVDSPYSIWDLSRYSLANERTFRQFISLEQGFNETGRSSFRWNKKRTIEDLNRDLRKYLRKTRHPLANFTTIERMEVLDRSPSGRILTLTVKTDKGMVELAKNEVRSAFEPPRSTLFYLEPVYDESKKLTAYNFVGGGFGHGVGLSQYGSYNLANLGWSAAQILAFYYPGTTIQSLNESIVFWRKPHTPLESETREMQESSLR
ncbi:MAG: SpoIID/LytB domain-containing protein [Xenococcaceae cyanobacterium MO_188.B32]|nr:SpoIID/LytB domain-containing protein [Xenococcaceae cyanobacterium MO_188.B32]